jgi:hypothetical protein
MTDDDSPDDQPHDDPPIDDDRSADPFVDLGAEPPDDAADDPIESLAADRPSSADSPGLTDERDVDPDSPLSGPSGDLDDESVWEDLSASTLTSVETERRGERRYAEVSKHDFCKNCEHFSAPPDVHCTHEGTEIVEFLDMETVRLVDCPVVEERERMADADSEPHR